MTAHILGQTTLSLRERNYPRPLPPDSRLALGFSLLEMMAVVAFILIVITISTPIYHSAEVLKTGTGGGTGGSGNTTWVTTVPSPSSSRDRVKAG